MRIGNNPEKDNFKLVPENYHRVVIPVYIPHFDGYFADVFEVFKLCLDSLLYTVHEKTRITLFNNNCHPDVVQYMDAKYKENPLIDQVFHSKENLGKINAILASVKGNLEPLITITDADVLFKMGWQQEVEKMFFSFPEAGMISPVPLSKTIKMHTANTWYYGFFKSKLRFKDVADSHAMHLFDVSLGNKELIYLPIHLEKYLTVQNQSKTAEAVVGCGHFVATLKREVFDLGSQSPAFKKIANGIESIYIDYPNEDLGYLRLATMQNYAFHMGNHTEKWMFEEFEQLKQNTDSKTFFAPFSLTSKPLKKWQTNIGKVLIRLFFYKKLKKIALKKLGLENGVNY